MDAAAAPLDRPIPEAAPASRASPLLSALFLLFGGLVLLRIALNPLLLDLVINYTSDAGSIVEKLHPALYGFVGIALVALLSFRIALDPWEVRVARAMMGFVSAIILILALTAAAGRGGSAGFLIDTYVAACFSALLFLFPHSWRLRLGEAVVLWLTLSAVVALAEFALKARLQPFSETEFSFRPVGLSSHPLDLGLWTACALPLCAATSWSRRTKLVVCSILLVGLGASGARLASMIGLGAAFLLALAAVGRSLPSQKRLERRIIVACAALIAIPLLVGALYAAGALDRFQGGLADGNARARVDIYGVFDHLSWSEIMLGTEAARVRKIALDYFKLEFIESSVVIFVTLFGVVGTVIFAGAFAWLLRILLIGARPAILLAVAMFFTVALSSNGLSSKGSAVFLLLTLVIAFRPAPAPRP